MPVYSRTSGAAQVVRREAGQSGAAEVAIDPLGNRTTFQYDALDRQTVTIDPLSARTTVAYDANGNVTQWQFDKVGNVTKETEPNGATVTWTYK